MTSRTQEQESINKARILLEGRITDCARTKSKFDKLKRQNCLNALKTLCLERLVLRKGKTSEIDLLGTETGRPGEIFPFGSNSNFEFNKCGCEEEEKRNIYASGIVESGYEKCRREMGRIYCKKALQDACIARKVFAQNFNFESVEE